MTHDNFDPRENEFAKLLESAAQSVNPNPVFKAELEDKLKAAHKPRAGLTANVWRNIFPALGWAGALVVLALLLSWAIRSLTPIPPQPAARSTPVKLTPTPEPIGEAYDRFGMKLYLAQPLPESSAQMNVYLARPEQHATIESVRALAAQFGMTEARVYETPSEHGGSETKDFLAVDGNQRLYVHSDTHFTYYPDYTIWQMPVVSTLDNPNAQTLITDFLASKGFNFEYRIEPTEMFGAYFIQSLTPDGFPIVHEYFKSNGILFRMNETEILSAEFSMLQYDMGGAYGIISAEEAFQKLLDPNNTSGIVEGMHGSSASGPKTWYRPRPHDQTITMWGWISSNLSVDGSAPLVTFENYTAIGNIADLPAYTENTFVEVTGQIRLENGADVFEVESWKKFDGLEDGLMGTLQRVGADVQLVSPEQGTFLLPDVPDEIPLPMENAYVIGVKQGDVFEWKTIEQFEDGMGGGGGGGGGGLGFRKLNLTGTPVPIPTLALEPVQVEPDQPPVGQRVEKLRGLFMMNIFRESDGSERVEFGLAIRPGTSAFEFVRLEGADLQSLSKVHNRPIDIWGTVDRYDEYRTPTIKVERYEVPFPDLQFQIVRGTQSLTEFDGQPLTLFTTEAGETYAQLSPTGFQDGNLIGNAGEVIVVEALFIPDETLGDYPAMRAFSIGQGVDPKTGQVTELTVTSDQPPVIDEPPADIGKDNALVYLVIERVELVYYTPDPRYLAPDQNGEPPYIQPAWLFTGHYSNGDEFFILVQALDVDFLLPELAPYSPPG